MSARIRVIGEFDGGRSTAYQLTPPLDYMGIREVECLLVVHNKDHGQPGWEPKTFIYPCDAQGRQTSYLELEIWAGAHLDHAQAADSFIREIEGWNDRARQRAARLTTLYRRVATLNDVDDFPLSHYQLTPPIVYRERLIEYLLICDTFDKDAIGQWVPTTFIYPATAGGQSVTKSFIQSYRGHSPHEHVVERFICQLEADKQDALADSQKAIGGEEE